MWDGKALGTSTATWKEMFQRSVAYKKEHNDTNAPQRYNKDSHVWDKKSLRNSTATWEEIYQQLVAYKTDHGDTCVPQHHKEDTHLGNWVITQSKAYRNKTIKEERKHLLDSIGFVWDDYDVKWTEL